MSYENTLNLQVIEENWTVKALKAY